MRPKLLPEVLTSEERQALLSSPNPACRTGLRNLCMLALMLNAGLRSAELLNLHPRDIDPATGRLKVRQGKGKKDRILWLSEADLELLQRWLKIRPDSQYLFCTLSGGKILSRYLRYLVKRLSTQAGIAKDIHPHTLRHTFATDLYRETKNIRLVQKALGHSDLSTTMIYTHIVDEELEEAMKTFREVAM